MTTDVFDSFIPKTSKYAIFDGDGEMRFTDNILENLKEKCRELGWGRIRRIRVNDKSIIFGEEVWRY